MKVFFDVRNDRFPYLWALILFAMTNEFLMAQVACQRFSLFGLVRDQRIIRFDGMLPEHDKGSVVYSVKNDIALIGTRLRALAPHPSGGIEFLTWESGDADVRLNHLSGRGDSISTILIPDKQTTASSTEVQYVIAARSSSRKDLVAVVSDSYKPSNSTRSVSIAPFDEDSLKVTSFLSQFEIKYNTSAYAYDYVAWEAKSNTLIYTNPAMSIVRYNPEDNQHSVICEGEFLGFGPNSDRMLIRHANKRLFICNLKGHILEELFFPRRFRNDKIGQILITPDGESMLFSTPRFIPLIEDARNFWRSSLDGSDVEKIGGTRGFSNGLCFAKDLD